MKPHCLILTYPLQGHINPMLQFSKRLALDGSTVTLVTTKHLFNTITNHHFPSAISVETISDGHDNDGYSRGHDFEAYTDTFRRVGSESLSELLESLDRSGRPVDCLIYNPFLPWGLTVGKRFGLVTAAFFTQPCFVDCIYYNVHKGRVKVPVSDQGAISIPGLGDVAALEFSDMPSFVRDPEARPGVLEMVVNQFRDIEEADFVFVNSVYELEKEVVDWMSTLLPVKTIGPTIPSMYLDKRVVEDKDYGLNMFKPVNTCGAWLDQQASGSVIYVSFGSMAEFDSVQMEELALALKATGKHFLWAVRSSEQHKLPNDVTSGGRGLVVSWAPQLEVLAHEAVGCFVTHCGWNSTLEALSLGVPVVAVPWWSDQTTNSKFVTDVWEMGVRARPDGENVVRRGEIVECVERVMGGGGGEMRRNARRWKEVIAAAVGEGGSSDRNIREFVSTLMHRGRKARHVESN